MDKSLTVFITGASSGLGAALARHYGSLGAKLGLCGRDADKLAEVASGLDAHCYSADVRNVHDMRYAAESFMAKAGVPDIVIGSAGISIGALTSEATDISVFQEVMDTNVMGLLQTFHPFISAMQERGQGILCGIGSVAGVRGLPGGGAYSASKAGAEVYLEALRLELKSSGIHVATILPGYIDTPMTAVNPYPMPFKISADKAAAMIARALAERKRHIVIPWQMAIVARLLRLLPRPAYDRLFERAPRKPRKFHT